MRAGRNRDHSNFLTCSFFFYTRTLAGGIFHGNISICHSSGASDSRAYASWSYRRHQVLCYTTVGASPSCTGILNDNKKWFLP